MNVWENAVITNQGLSLLSKLMAGNTLEILRAEAGSGYVTPGLLTTQGFVVGMEQELLFRAVSYPEEGKCKLTCYLTNDGVYEGYTARQIGIYAWDPEENEEILFFIAQSQSDKGTEVPSGSEMVGYSAEWNFYFTYGQADGVSVTVDQTGTVSRQEMEEALKDKANKDLSNIPDDVFAMKVTNTVATGSPRVMANSDDGIIYTATVPHVKELSNGMEIIIIPSRTSNSTSPTLNVNGLGAKPIKQATLDDTLTLSELVSADFLAAGTPVKLIYSNEAEAWRIDIPAIAEVTPAQIGAAPAYTYGTADLTAGSSALETGKLYFVYE